MYLLCPHFYYSYESLNFFQSAFVVSMSGRQLLSLAYLLSLCFLYAVHKKYKKTNKPKKNNKKQKTPRETTYGEGGLLTAPWLVPGGTNYTAVDSPGAGGVG